MPTINFENIGDVLDYDILTGTILTIDTAEDTCTVSVGGAVVAAPLFYHCSPSGTERSNGAIEGAADGFTVGDSVIVLKNKDSGITPLVVGHTDGARQCATDAGDYFFAFHYDDDDGFYVQNLTPTWDVISTKSMVSELWAVDLNDEMVFHLKKFYHNGQTLYFVAAPFDILTDTLWAGWTAFATANPTHALVTNNSNTQIAITPAVLTDLNSVNADVNNAHLYISDPAGNDNWHILGSGDSGDCEDFALTKAQALLDLGYPASALHIETSMYSGGGSIGHAWLVVQTTGGDYALDISSDSIVTNSLLEGPGGTEYYTRRRQIGSNWGCISPLSWLQSAGNVTYPWTYWYVFDPALNMFYQIPTDGPILYPFYVGYDASLDLSGPSINFSGTQIHVAYDGTLKHFQLDENQLTLLSESSYTGGGYVGTDGNIEAPDGTYGRQDPYAFGDEYDNVQLSEWDDLWHLYSIDEDRQGDFKALWNIEVISGDGYYDYNYMYLTGEFTETTDEVPETSKTLTVTIDWQDVEGGNNTLHAQSVWNYGWDLDAEDWELLSVVDDPFVNTNRYFYSAILNDSYGTGLYLDYELLDHLYYPVGTPWEAEDQTGVLTIPYNSEEIDAYGSNYETYGLYVPYRWAQLEINDSYLVQGVVISRDPDGTPPDDLKRLYKNKGLITISDSLKGMGYIPFTDRLT